MCAHLDQGCMIGPPFATSRGYPGHHKWGPRGTTPPMLICLQHSPDLTGQYLQQDYFERQFELQHQKSREHEKEQAKVKDYKNIPHLIGSITQLLRERKGEAQDENETHRDKKRYSEGGDISEDVTARYIEFINKKKGLNQRNKKVETIVHQLCTKLKQDLNRYQVLPEQRIVRKTPPRQIVRFAVQEHNQDIYMPKINFFESFDYTPAAGTEKQSIHVEFDPDAQSIMNQGQKSEQSTLSVRQTPQNNPRFRYTGGITPMPSQNSKNNPLLGLKLYKQTSSPRLFNNNQELVLNDKLFPSIREFSTNENQHSEYFSSFAQQTSDTKAILNKLNQVMTDTKINHRTIDSTTLSSLPSDDPQITANPLYFGGPPNFIAAIFEPDDAGTVNVASPNQLQTVKKLFNEAYKVERIFGNQTEDSISVFKSKLASIAAKRRAKLHTDRPQSKSEKERTRQMRHQLSKSVDWNMDPQVIQMERVRQRAGSYKVNDEAQMIRRSMEMMMDPFVKSQWQQYQISKGEEDKDRQALDKQVLIRVSNFLLTEQLEFFHIRFLLNPCTRYLIQGLRNVASGQMKFGHSKRISGCQFSSAIKIQWKLRKRNKRLELAAQLLIKSVPKVSLEHMENQIFLDIY